jgi:hypothetical protein
MEYSEFYTRIDPEHHTQNNNNSFSYCSCFLSCGTFIYVLVYCPLIIGKLLVCMISSKSKVILS